MIFVVFTGADDLEQLTELSEEEFTQLCAMIGMDKKPFHVLRFRKALEKPPPSSTGVPVPLNQTPVNPTPSLATLTTAAIAAPPSLTCTAISTPTSSSYFNNLPQASLSIPATGAISQQPPPINVLHHPTGMPMATMQGVMVTAAIPPPSISHTHSPQLQVQGGQPSRALLEALSTNEAKYGPPKIILQQTDTGRSKASLPPYLMPNSECRTFDDLVDDRTPIQKALGPPPFSPNIWDSNRRELIRRYSAIYGKSGGDRRQKEVFSDFEIHINEAAFQLCLRDPTLLVRREELYVLAKRAIKEGGYAYYHGFSKTKESLNSLTSGPSSNNMALNSSSGSTGGGQKHPRSIDTDLDEVNMPPTKLVSLKTALNIPSKLSVKRRLEHMQELENLITENKSQQAVKLAALERAQQNGDFSVAYSIQLDVESLGMTCEQLQTAYTTLKKRQYRSARYFKKKQDKDTTSSDMEASTDLETNTSSVATSFTIPGTTALPTNGPIQLIDTNILFSSPSITSPMVRPMSASASGGSSSTPKLSHRNHTTKGGSSRITTRPSSKVTATVIPSTSSHHQQQQQFDTRTHTVTVTVPSQDDSSDPEVRNLVENVSHATDEVNSLMIRELNKQLAWEDLQ
jgi:hypothetical protein